MAKKKAAPAKKAPAKAAAPKPIKEALNKSGLVAHIAEASAVAAKDVRAVLAAYSFALTSSAFAALAPDFVEKLTAESRPLEDRVRDGARRPYQVMQLLGVNAGDTLLDVGAGGGWFTRVLSAATGPSGKVIAQFGPRALQQQNGQAQKDLATSLGNTEAYFGNVGELPDNSVDAAVTALIHETEDAKEGPRAFSEKRVPQFKNR